MALADWKLGVQRAANEDGWRPYTTKQRRRCSLLWAVQWHNCRLWGRLGRGWSCRQLLLLEFLPLLLLHATILKPDLDLRLVQTERRRDLDAASSRQVAIEVELFLELGQLLVGEVGAAEVGCWLQRLAMSNAVVPTVHQQIMLRVDIQRAVLTHRVSYKHKKKYYSKLSRWYNNTHCVSKKRFNFQMYSSQSIAAVQWPEYRIPLHW